RHLLSFPTRRSSDLIAMSRFGYLRTPLPKDASPEAQADGHACLRNALNLDRVAVVGGSAGAPSAMQLCLRYPEHCLALGLLFPIDRKSTRLNSSHVA